GASGNCTVTSGTVHLTGAGSCTITASQAGDSNYNAAPNVPQTFSIAKANQTITFGALANKTFGDADFGVSATASSGLAVSFGASGNCTVTSGTVHLTGAGSCTITASQAGDSNYNAAPNVPQTFSIAKVASATAVSSSVNPSGLAQSVTFTATVSSTAGTPTGTVQFKDNATNLGAPVTLNASGVATLTTAALTAATHTITADYSGDGNFGVSSGTLSGGQVVSSQPSLSINSTSIPEGDSGTRSMNFTVTLSAASNLSITVNFSTANGTATAGFDYVAASGTLTFDPGDTTKTVPVTINGDVNFESDENFTVNLSAPTNASINVGTGTGTILNDDAAGGFISLSQSTYNVNEATGFVDITVNRTNDLSQAVSVDYSTDDTGAPVACGSNNGHASARCDFTTAIGTLQFAAGESQKTFTVLVNQDSFTEGSEMFTVSLSNATGGALWASPSSATITITDSAVGSTPANLIDDPTFFVRQHYHDFLNREPDAPGLAFWVNQLTSCGNDVACLEVRRLNVSASFFLSIEFQQTGATSYLTNIVAFNSMPTFNRFEADSQALGRGYIFTAPGSAAVLEANKVAYFNKFVSRSDFLAIYGGLTNAQYVDQLIANTGVGFDQSTRAALFNGLDSGAETRATVLRKIVETPSFLQAQTNRMFVLMEYVGYLRRHPSDPPDNNLNGYNFWLTKLNQFNGNYIDAEMVKAFLSSIEYRQRFGP
ncbi:MAG TPA: Calx-beta domain-containing protein, partial [Pyrinomonadaceae bacterium]|nr:Calx-beta domain-containing protein [Pyrinomonadaceae bacterium]